MESYNKYSYNRNYNFSKEVKEIYYSNFTEDEIVKMFLTEIAYKKRETTYLRIYVLPYHNPHLYPHLKKIENLKITTLHYMIKYILSYLIKLPFTSETTSILIADMKRLLHMNFEDKVIVLDQSFSSKLVSSGYRIKYTYFGLSEMGTYSWIVDSIRRGEVLEDKFLNTWFFGREKYLREIYFYTNDPHKITSGDKIMRLNEIKDIIKKKKYIYIVDPVVYIPIRKVEFNKIKKYIYGWFEDGESIFLFTTFLPIQLINNFEFILEK